MSVLDKLVQASTCEAIGLGQGLGLGLGQGKGP
jgi:hypothetical protein